MDAAQEAHRGLNRKAAGLTGPVQIGKMHDVDKHTQIHMLQCSVFTHGY